ncbi:23600_t:CDS:2, partial [Dentiscutata erythropus]
LWLILLSIYTIIVIKSDLVIPSPFEIKRHIEIPRPFVACTCGASSKSSKYELEHLYIPSIPINLLINPFLNR